MRVFGLIGYPLSHSYSADFFNSKFSTLGLDDHLYKLFPIKHISEIRNLLKSEPDITGLNVTIPFKEQVIEFLDEISPEAGKIGAVNCISIRSGKLTGYNTDCFGFEKAYISHILDAASPVLVLGNGGASKAVQYVLQKNDLCFQVVSRNKTDINISYSDLNSEIIRNHKVIINTTSLGMYPETDTTPPVNFDQLSENHLLIDLIYNPEITIFLKYGISKGCKIFNGLYMLEYQAEKSWEIWESTM